MSETSPLDDIRRIVAELPPPDLVAGATLRKRLCGSGSPDRLQALAVKLAQTQNRAQPVVRQPVVTVFAAAHGVASRGVSRLEQDDVPHLVARLGQGGAALNGICASFGLGLKVFELAPHLPTVDFTLQAALDARGFAATLAFGMEAAAGGADLLAVAGLAAGAETSAAAVAAALTGGPAADWTEPELPMHTKLRRIETIEAGLVRHAAHLGDPLEVLARLGGRETAAAAGAILAARVQRAAAILDGDAAIAAALALHALRPEAVAHCVLAQRLRSPALTQAAVDIGLTPLLDLGIDAAGEAGAVALGITRAAAAAAAPSS